ncbi:3D domain-containing protein [Solibacillus daqui]|uniref:3D domain-containing protein n=1 Tax=Solibacillus daqui TaxID=2912187 RepID=UPI00236534E0|nr:3D domain-containing protein [Solibacillus daqui]
MFKHKLILSLSLVLFSSILFVNTTNAATYTVKAGDKIEEIAKRYDTTVQELLELNRLQNANDIVEHLVLILPEEKPKETPKEQPKKSVEKIETIDDYEVVKTLTVEASAFTASCNGCSGKTAYGIDLHKNPDIKLIAVDPDMIPLGTKVWVKGYGIAIAGDTGGSIKGGKIDVFMKTKKEAYSWGRKKVEIKILK